MCSWSGGGHFYSFDGAKVDYQGTCMFNMGSDCLANRLSLIGNSENRGGVASVSYVSYIVMRFGSTSGRITFIAGHYPSPADTSKVLVS